MCEHEKLRTVGDRLFCIDCGKELPVEFLTGTVKAEKQAEKTAPAEKTDKPTSRKGRPKKTV
jgi:hypothetical protein